MFFPNTKNGWADVYMDNSFIEKEGYNVLQIALKEQNDDIFNSLLNRKTGRIIAPLYAEPEKNNIVVTRFLSKCAIEYLTYRVIKGEGWYDFIRDKQFIPLIKYARYGEGAFWPYSQRRIYGEGVGLIDDKKGIPYEVLHEMDFLMIDEGLYYYT